MPPTHDGAARYVPRDLSHCHGDSEGPAGQGPVGQWRHEGYAGLAPGPGPGRAGCAIDGRTRGMLMQLTRWSDTVTPSPAAAWPYDGPYHAKCRIQSHDVTLRFIGVGKVDHGEKNDKEVFNSIDTASLQISLQISQLWETLSGSVIQNRKEEVCAQRTRGRLKVGTNGEN